MIKTFSLIATKAGVTASVCRRILPLAAVGVILLLVWLDTATALLWLMKKVDGFPPAAWAIAPPNWVD